jgi:hypothetical protein
MDETLAVNELLLIKVVMGEKIVYFLKKTHFSLYPVDIYIEISTPIKNLT